MKQKILKNRGAYQENIVSEASAPPIPRKASLKRHRSIQQAPALQVQSISNVMQEQMLFDEDPFANDYVSMHDTGINIPTIGSLVGGTQSMAAMGGAPPGGPSNKEPQDSRDPATDPYELNLEFKRMFHTTIPEGQQALISDKEGRGELVKGPARVWTYKKRVQWLAHHIAFPGEFLIVKFRDGSQKHILGPAELWLDPRVHSTVEKEDAVQIAAKEAVVVYSEADGGDIERSIVEGPAVFVPKPGEWLHTFSWHGSKGGGTGYTKVPGGLVFQKLWLMPDQMYHDVDDVRTADDVVLTIRLMIFFELADVEKMLQETHDPIGDFINAASSDVLDLVSRYTFDEFKTKTEQLNKLEHYSQLLERSKQVGYKLHKIVYRGYATSEALERMHEQAIETRTRLKLERETENQAQELADFKQQREFQRASSSRHQEKENEEHELDKQRKRHEQQVELQRQRREEERQQRLLDTRQQHELQEQHLKQWLELNDKLREMGVDLTAYLTQSRADQVIELRGEDGKQVAPHLHLMEGHVSRSANKS